jgi:hypothetical protein
MPRKEESADPRILTKVIDEVFDGQGDGKHHEICPLGINPGSRGIMTPRYRDGTPVDDNDEGRP